MKQVGCVISLSSSSVHTSALLACCIGHVDALHSLCSKQISLDVWTKSNDKLILNTYLPAQGTNSTNPLLTRSKT